MIKSKKYTVNANKVKKNMSQPTAISNAISKLRQIAKLRKGPVVKRSIVDNAIIKCLQFMYDSKRVDWHYYVHMSPLEFETKRKVIRTNLNELVYALNSINVQDPEFDKLKDFLTGYRTQMFKGLESKNEQELIRLSLFEEDTDAMLFHHILAFLSNII